ncbi:hypothetical protein KUCAC02_026987 [Chaenocephalus aceratus]|nr:hypothetical protein KUCAC02_026987 [Chaenocephalus aceratus]
MMQLTIVWHNWLKRTSAVSLGTFDFILWHREWTTSGAVSDRIVKSIPVSDKIFLPRLVGDCSPERGNHFILWVLDFKAKQIKIYDSLMLFPKISDGDMDILRNVFTLSGGLQGWTVTCPPQWKQQDSVNCGVFVCAAAENEVRNLDVTAETLTLNQCRTLRLHHASQMLKTVNVEDFPPTTEELAKVKQKEIELLEAEAKQPDSSSHCPAWKIKSGILEALEGMSGDIMTDEEIQDLERNLQSGTVLSNRMYLWTHKGLDPALRQHYSEHCTLFNDRKTEEIIQRIQNILSLPGTVAEKQLYISGVLLPEVFIQWMSREKKICRYQAESVLLECTSKRRTRADMTGDEAHIPEEENILITRMKAAAVWCQHTVFEKGLKLPAFLSMDKDTQSETLKALQSWQGETDEDDSPHELFTFEFDQRKDYETFCLKQYKVFASFKSQ